MQEQNRHTEIAREMKIIKLFALFTVGIFLIVNLVSYIHLDTMHRVTEDIYEHPLKVSNAALNVQKGVLKIHRDMKDIVLTTSIKSVQKISKKVDAEEKNIYEYLKIIEKNVLGKEGYGLYEETYKLFKDWKSIRDGVIKLVESNNIQEAVRITREEGALHVRHLETVAVSLNKYANAKADMFESKADDSFKSYINVNIVLTLVTLILFLFFLFYIRQRIGNYLKLIGESEREYKALLEQYSLAIEGTNDGLWDWNIAEESVYFSARWKEMLGYKESELENSFETWESRVHPDDLDSALKMIELAHSDPKIEYRIIHRLRHKDGHWVWIFDRGQTLFDESGKAIRMIGFHTDITELKEQEQKIKNLSILLKNTLHSFENLIFVKDKDFKYIECNSAFADFVGLEKEAIIGHDDFDLFDEELASFFRKKDKEMLEAGETKNNYEWVNYPNGVKVYLLTTKAPLRDENENIVGIVGNSVDVTKEHKATKEIQRVLSAFDRSNISVIMTDLSGDITYVNPNWCKVTGYRRDELIGQNPRIVKSGDISAESYSKMWAHLTSGKVWSSEIKNKAKDGSIFWEDSTIMPSFSADGEIDGYISFKIEINEKVHLKEELKKKDEIMMAQSRHAAMGEMISMIAHQWRQPISIIAMDANNILADIELDMLSSETLSEASKDIISQTQELSKTIDDFREFFKPNRDTEEVLLRDVIADALAVIGKALENNNIAIEIDRCKPINIRTYSRELMQVVINIIKNAKEVLVEKEIQERKIMFHCAHNESKVSLSICDNGGGINMDIMQKIFNPYFTTKSAKNGTGLGLYMSKTIIEKHLEGSISATNSDEGACFTIELPLEIVGGEGIADESKS